MRVPRWFAFVLGILVVIALSRSILNSGPLSLYTIIEEFQGFDLGFDDIFDTLSNFTDLLFDGTLWWNDDLTGFSGFIVNIKNTVISVFTLFKNAIVVPLKIFIDFVVAIVNFVRDLFSLISMIFGW